MAEISYQMKEVFINSILLSREGLTFFSNRTNSFGEKRKMKLPTVSFFKDTRKNFKLNLILVLVLVLKS